MNRIPGFNKRSRQGIKIQNKMTKALLEDLELCVDF